MRDGTTLRADVYRPLTDAKVPVILMRLPYDKDGAEQRAETYERPEFYAQHCYLVVIQDVRGQYKSPGEWYPFKHEMTDGYDSVEWAAALPGSNGKVGMYGYSYVGATQWLAATQTPPHLVTIIPTHTGSDYYDGWTYQNGALSLAFAESWPLSSIGKSYAEQRGDWQLSAEMERNLGQLNDTWYSHLPLKTFPPLHPGDPEVAPYFFDWLNHPTYDAYWQQWAPKERYDKVKVPVLNIAGWYDSFLTGGIENFTGMKARGGSQLARANQQLVIGPWIHSNWTRYQPNVINPLMDYGPAADNPVDELQLGWFDHWLKGKRNQVSQDPAVRLFVMGANRWLRAGNWPVPGTEYRDYYLASQGQANSASGNGRLERAASSGKGAATDSYRYDPKNPVPSAGGHACCGPPTTPMGPAEQSAVEARNDVLVYTTEKLQRDLVVAGPVSVRLFASSSAVDTDFTAKLVDVQPDGRTMILNDGIVRASYRDSLTNPSPITPGKIYQYDIEVWPTANMFKAGHQIRLEISSSSFPAYDRNPNTGEAFGTSANTKVADQVIYHDPQHPSALRLPVLPAGAITWDRMSTD
ncbi:CocE/NonD family hydrolase [Planosporangium flavigriseum]|nr:CocE/NonD family hydrolase [Planosporangium flavigriseum]